VLKPEFDADLPVNRRHVKKLQNDLKTLIVFLLSDIPSAFTMTDLKAAPTKNVYIFRKGRSDGTIKQKELVSFLLCYFRVDFHV